ncbi:MAG: hypothetical protein M1514_01920, partial [Patescibacteria group bacterium]|nr:hypothetical protein [Patescibacteria group bacterium]
GNYYNFDSELFRNPAISSAFEPGSIFKVLVMAVYGSSVSKLEKEISSLDKENREIESEIASLTSFFSISQKIAENSLITTDQIENEAVAYKR